MTNRHLIGSVALLALLTLATASVGAEDEGKYPDWGGQWLRTGGIQFDLDEAARPRPAGAAHVRIPGQVRGGPC